jgi:hypothetical protein
MIEFRDEKGRIARPSGPPHAVPRSQDEKSERPTRNPGQFTMRMPKAWRIALDNLARRERKTLTELVLNALESTYAATLHPALHGRTLLQDGAPSMPNLLGQNTRRAAARRSDPKSGDRSAAKIRSRSVATA